MRLLWILGEWPFSLSRNLLTKRARFVQTDMGNAGAKLVGMKEATTPIDDCVAGMLKVIDESTREKTSGRFPIWEGGEFPW